MEGGGSTGRGSAGGIVVEFSGEGFCLEEEAGGAPFPAAYTAAFIFTMRTSRSLMNSA